MSSKKSLEIILGLIVLCLVILVPPFVNAVQQNTVSTDYAAYVKNDIVSVSGTFNSPDAIMLSIVITNPNGVSRLWQTNGNSDGTFQTNYPLSENTWLVPGIYHLNVLSGTQNMSSTKFVFVSDDSIKIPNELKTITGQWVLGKIDDASFIKNIQYYVNTGMLRIPYTFSGQSQTNQPIPQWVYANSRAWLQGSSDAGFAKGLYFLYYADYLPVKLDNDFQPFQKLTVIQTTNMSNSHVILSIVNGSENVREGQTIELKGQVIEQLTNKTLGIPNAMFSIVDTDNGKEIGNGTSDYFGVFHFSWIATMDGKSTRNLMGVYHGNEQLSPSQSSVLTFQVLPPQIGAQSIVSNNKTVSFQKESASSNTTILPAPVIQPAPEQVQSAPPEESIPPQTQSIPNEIPTLLTQNQSSKYDYSSMMTGLVILVVIILIIYFGYKKSRQSTAERFQREKQESQQREQSERQQREQYERRQREQYEQSQQRNQGQSGSRRKETKAESHEYSDTLKTYYIILGLEPGVSKEQVKERYRELSKMVHPDKNQGSNASTDIMKKYNEAYHAIMDDLR